MAPCVQFEEVAVKEAVALEQGPPGPAVRKRKRRSHKAAAETVTEQKVSNISPKNPHTQRSVSWHFGTLIHCVIKVSKAMFTLASKVSQIRSVHVNVKRQNHTNQIF